MISMSMVSSSGTFVNKDVMSKLATYISFVSRFKLRNSAIKEKVSVTIRGLVETAQERN